MLTIDTPLPEVFDHCVALYISQLVMQRIHTNTAEQATAIFLHNRWNIP